MSSTARKCLGSAFISEVVQDLVNLMGRGVGTAAAQSSLDLLAPNSRYHLVSTSYHVPGSYKWPPKFSLNLHPTL